MKNTFIISIEVSTDIDLTDLISVVKMYKTWAHITQFTWAIKTSEKVKEIRDKIAEVLPKGSRIFVIKSGTWSAWKNVICSNDWLKNNL